MTSTETRHWPTTEHEQLFQAIASMKTPEEASRLLRDLCTVSELDAMAHRWQVAPPPDEGLPYLEVAKRAHASTTTVTRVAQWLRRGEGGYTLALRRRRRAGWGSPPPRRGGCASRRSSSCTTRGSVRRRPVTARLRS